MALITISETLTADSVNDIIVGSVSKVRSVRIRYSAQRDTLKEDGNIIVQNNTDLPTPAISQWGDDCGLWSELAPLAMKIEGDNLILSITVDDSSAEDVSFNYIKREIKI